MIALRALEAAVRNRSYSRAAAELNVTHGAVSQHMRRLEEQLGTRLFQRRGNGMEPLPVAAKIATSVAAAMALLDRAIEEAGTDRALEPLVLSVEQGFARRWLMPRIMRLRVGEPDLELRLENRLADLVGDGVDGAVRYGSGEWPGCETARIFGVRLFPVCSPAFLERHPLTRLEDLYDLPLLRHTHPLWSWPHWFRAQGMPPPPDRGMRFDDSSLMLDAAGQGVGVALARDRLVERDLMNQTLVRPIAAEAESSWGYFFVWRAGTPRLARLLALRDWLLAEALPGGEQQQLAAIREVQGAP